MLSIQRQISLASPQNVAFTLGSVQDAPMRARQRATPAQAGVMRFLGSTAQNARLPVALRGGTWSAVWSHPLKVNGTPVVVLEGRDHVLVQAGDWFLLRDNGDLVASGQMGRSALTADGSTNVFYLVNQANNIEARSLETGDLQFRWPLAFGEGFSFPLMNRSGWKILISGVEHRLFGHPPTEPTMGVLYLLEMSGVTTNPAKMLLSVKRSETLIFNDPFMLTAMSGEKSAVASADHIAIVSGDLQIEGVFAAPGLAPVLLSVDETGWLHVVSAHGNDRALWIVTPDGRRVVNVGLDRRLGAPLAPPAIGYDRRVYLWNASTLYAFGPDGRSLWQWSAKGAIEGIGITTDDQVLVTAGEEVSSVDQTGNAHTLFRFSGERAAGPPVLAGNGDLLVPTTTRLYRLRATR